MVATTGDRLVPDQYGESLCGDSAACVHFAVPVSAVLITLGCVYAVQPDALAADLNRVAVDHAAWAGVTTARSGASIFRVTKKHEVATIRVWLLSAMPKASSLPF